MSKKLEWRVDFPISKTIFFFRAEQCKEWNQNRLFSPKHLAFKDDCLCLAGMRGCAAAAAAVVDFHLFNKSWKERKQLENKRTTKKMEVRKTFCYFLPLLLPFPPAGIELGSPSPMPMTASEGNLTALTRRTGIRTGIKDSNMFVFKCYVRSAQSHVNVSLRKKTYSSI